MSLADMQRRPDLLDAPVSILLISIDSEAPASQNGVSKMSNDLHHSGLDRLNILDRFH